MVKRAYPNREESRLNREKQVVALLGRQRSPEAPREDARNYIREFFPKPTQTSRKMKDFSLKKLGRIGLRKL